MCGMIAELKILATTTLESKNLLMITTIKPLKPKQNEQTNSSRMVAKATK